jgi:hypothetical protein
VLDIFGNSLTFKINNMEKIPTAEEFIQEAQRNPGKGWTARKTMIEFAKLHVEAALKEASEAATINKNKGQVTGREFGNVTNGSYSINQPSILNSYPLDKIK